MYQPSAPFTVPLTLLTTETVRINGVLVKRRSEGRTFPASFRTFGGTEREADGLTVVEDTAVVETWFSPDILAGDAVRTEDGTEWEILGTPEDISMRHQWIRMKIRRARGGA